MSAIIKYFTARAPSSPSPSSPPTPSTPEITNPYLYSQCRDESNRFIACIQSSWPDSSGKIEKAASCEQRLREFMRCIGPTV